VVIAADAFVAGIAAGRFMAHTCPQKFKAAKREAAANIAADTHAERSASTRTLAIMASALIIAHATTMKSNPIRVASIRLMPAPLYKPCRLA
jgi:hypothetical protein